MPNFVADIYNPNSGDTAEQKVKKLENAYIEVVNQLRWLLSNLDQANIGKSKIKTDQIIIGKATIDTALIDELIVGGNVTIGTARQTFVGVTPTIPYYIGDIWFTTGTASTGDVKKCITERLTGAYTAGDWVIGTNYDNTQTTINNGLITTGSIILQDGTSPTPLEKAGITADSDGDASVRIWAGDTYTNRGTAPFRVTQGGAFTATNGTLTGTFKTGADGSLRIEVTGALLESKNASDQLNGVKILNSADGNECKLSMYSSATLMFIVNTIKGASNSVVVESGDPTTDDMTINAENLILQTNSGGKLYRESIGTGHDIKTLEENNLLYSDISHTHGDIYVKDKNAADLRLVRTAGNVLEVYEGTTLKGYVALSI